ncbi:MAG: Stf0 family sulfotransferase [Rhodanobacter sp.]
MEKQGRHLARRLYDAEFDFNCFGREPLGTYMLATLPRSGSTYCAIKLWQTGLLGSPMEYLNFGVIADLYQRLGYPISGDGGVLSGHVQSYWRSVKIIRTSLNGVFGWKMFTSNFLEISKKYPELLKEITPNYVLYLTRRDELGQAFSYSRAMRSKTWFGGIANVSEVAYDFFHIKKCLRLIREQKRCWEDIFDTVEIEPIRIFYEDLLSDAESFTGCILGRMGIKVDRTSRIDIPVTLRQTDGISRIWRNRFAEDESHEAISAEKKTPD